MIPPLGTRQVFDRKGRNDVMKIKTNINITNHLGGGSDATAFACTKVNRAAPSSGEKIITLASKQPGLIIVAVLIAVLVGLQGQAQAPATRSRVVHALRSPMVQDRKSVV